MTLRSIVDRFLTFIRSRSTLVREINQKYSHPRISMKPWQKAALFGLLLYLVLLIVIFIFKFITLIL